MKTNQVCWFEITVTDMDRAKQFYEAILQTELTKLESPDPVREMFGFPMDFESMGSSGALVSEPNFTPRSCGTTIYFSCEDCGVEASRVEQAGGRLKLPKTSIGEYGFYALALDPDGNVFGLHSTD